MVLGNDFALQLRVILLGAGGVGNALWIRCSGLLIGINLDNDMFAHEILLQ